MDPVQAPIKPATGDTPTTDTAKTTSTSEGAKKLNKTVKDPTVLAKVSFLKAEVEFIKLEEQARSKTNSDYKYAHSRHTLLNPDGSEAKTSKEVRLARKKDYESIRETDLRKSEYNKFIQGVGYTKGDASTVDKEPGKCERNFTGLQSINGASEAETIEQRATFLRQKNEELKIFATGKIPEISKTVNSSPKQGSAADSAADPASIVKKQLEEMQKASEDTPTTATVTNDTPTTATAKQTK